LLAPPFFAAFAASISLFPAGVKGFPAREPFAPPFEALPANVAGGSISKPEHEAEYAWDASSKTEASKDVLGSTLVPP
jgi:hypothetical protein